MTDGQLQWVNTMKSMVSQKADECAQADEREPPCMLRARRKSSPAAIPHLYPYPCP